MEYGLPGAAKNTGGEALLFLIPPLKGEGRRRRRRGGVTSLLDAHAPTRLAALATLPRKWGRDKKAKRASHAFGFFALNTTKCESEKFTTKLAAIEMSFAPSSGIT